jgi:hypothetical protein
VFVPLRHLFQIGTGIGKDFSPFYLHIENLFDHHQPTAMALLTLKEINDRDIVDFLSSIGHQPKIVRGRNFWYLSMLPERSEKTASFKVDRVKNKWIDFGYDSHEHSLVDLGILLFNCTIREFVLLMSGPGASLRPVSRWAPPAESDETRKLEITRTYPLRSEYLIRYIWERRIAISVSQKFCVEAEYTFDQKKFYYAVAFPSDAGGWNLRSKYHKYSSSPKSPTLICNGSDHVAVFEGYFNMMTLVTLLSCPDHQLPDLLVLNSASFFLQYLWLMETYKIKHLFLDNGATGDQLTRAALSRKKGYLDHRPLHPGYEDLNAWLCGTPRIPPRLRLDTLPFVATTSP